MEIAEPMVRKIEDTPKALGQFEKEISGESKEILAEFPTVYIHSWEDTDEYEVYIGESNDVFRRSREHFEVSQKDPNSWQRKMRDKGGSLYILGHEHFNKSLTLDVENCLMQYMISVPKVRQIHNLRGNPQNHYYPMGELSEVVSKAWSRLNRDNRELFPDESLLRSLAIFKSSPLHKLTEEQFDARKRIIERLKKALEGGKRGQLIFVEGEAGTGKTVLNSSTFYEIFCLAKEGKFNLGSKGLRCCLLVNHEEQVHVYEQIVKKLGLTDQYEDLVAKPTSFINHHSADDPVDIIFVDEAHLLLTQGRQSYQGKNQLEDIIARAKVTVVMFDENQILTTEAYWEQQLLNHYRSQARESGNYIHLYSQLRMHAGEEMMNWIDAFSKKRQIEPIPEPTEDYCIRIFSNPGEMESEIREKAEADSTPLSRMIATYDWEYKANKRPSDHLETYWNVIVGEWKMPWNYQCKAELTQRERAQIREQAWAEQRHTINEVGSTFTIQGFDLNYAGLILGPSVKYRKGRVVFDPSKSCNAKAVQNRTLSDGSKEKFGQILLQHEVRVLMTRAVDGLFIYACDEQLREALLKARR